MMNKRSGFTLVELLVTTVELMVTTGVMFLVLALLSVGAFFLIDHFKMNKEVSEEVSEFPIEETNTVYETDGNIKNAHIPGGLSEFKHDGHTYLLLQVSSASYKTAGLGLTHSGSCQHESH
jgi:hypothetical protein